MTTEINIFSLPETALTAQLAMLDEAAQQYALSLDQHALRCALLLLLKRTDEALAIVDFLVENPQELSEASAIQVGRAMLRTQQHRRAYDLLSPFAESGTQNLFLLTILAIIGNRLSNIPLIERVVKNTPEDFTEPHPIINWLVSAALRVHQHEKALRVARRNYDLSPSAEGFSVIMRCYEAMDLPYQKVSYGLEALARKTPVNRPQYHNLHNTLKMLAQPQLTGTQTPRIALCLSGQMRAFEAAAPSVFKNLIDRFTTDIFISTWDNRGFKSSGFQFINRLLPDAFEAIFPYQYLEGNFPLRFPETVELLKRIESTPVTEDEIRRCYPNAEIEILSESRFEEQYFTSAARQVAPTPAHINQLKMFHGIFAANAMKKRAEVKHGTKYDLVIRLRPDCNLPEFQVLHTSAYRSQIVVDKIHPEGFGDQFAMSTSQNMDLYAGVWAAAQSIVTGTFDTRFHTSATKLGPHQFLQDHLRSTGLCATNKGFPSQDIIADLRPMPALIAPVMLQDMAQWPTLTQEDTRLRQALEGLLNPT